MSKKSSAAVKLQPVAVTERAVGLRSYLLRHQHILDAATIADTLKAAHDAIRARGAS